jgi:hypothetical protein
MDDRFSLGDLAAFAVDLDKDLFVERLGDLCEQCRDDLDVPTRCLD